MDSLTAAIQRCNLKLKLDNETKGQGNCFPNSIVQQCRRPEIREWLQQNKPSGVFNGQKWVRHKVTNFALSSHHKSVIDLKTKYEQEIQQVEQKSWMEYWSHMAQDGTWVDHMFVQMVAWFMELDIMILTTSSNPDAPFIFISGDIDKMGNHKSGPPLLLGNYTNVHYQSILIDQSENERSGQEESHKESKLKEKENKDFVYIQNEEKVVLKSIGYGKFECPVCKKYFTSILKHITVGKCKILKYDMDLNEFRNQHGAFKK